MGGVDVLCLKCGREVFAEQVFCDSCLAIMEKSPVKSGTPVLLPSPKYQASSKKQTHRKRVLSAEEQVVHLRSALRRMYLCVAVLIVVLGMATALLVNEILKEEAPAIGQNYTIDTTMTTE